MREEIRLSISRQAMSRLGRTEAAKAAAGEVMAEARRLGWIDDAVAEAIMELQHIEDDIALRALATTGPEYRDRLTWIEQQLEQRVSIRDGQTLMHPRPIACLLTPPPKEIC